MKKLLRRLSLTIISATLAVSSMAVPVAADTYPPAGTPATVSADPLPTVQVNNIVWAQVTVGNTVYATGNFTKARPADSAPGQNEVTRNRILAYDIRTGNLIPEFNHSLNAEARAITASPDGKRLYVGGKFTNADGRTVNRIAAFDISTKAGSLITSFTGGPTNGIVKALAATNYTLYVGGEFSAVSGGHSRTRLAAYSLNGELHAWTPRANRDVSALVLTPDESKVVIGGSFDKINDTTFYGLGAVTATSPGTPITSWASARSDFPIHMNDVNDLGGITSLSTNGNLIFFTAYSYLVADRSKKFEGRGAISPTDGRMIWMNDCLGDTYSAIPIGGVLYSAGHSHDCTRVDSFPETKTVRLLAETITVDGVNKYIPLPNYWNHPGQPRSSVLNWFPLLNTGNFSGSNQAAWSITGNTQYVSAGGEFTKAGGRDQQGLVRYAIASLAPKDQGPIFNHRYGILTANAGRADAGGGLLMRIRPAHDRDNGLLHYQLYRDADREPIYKFNLDTRFWVLPDVYFTDTGLRPGSVHTYRLVASDPWGRKAETYSLVDDKFPGITYSGTRWYSDQNRNGEYDSGVHHTTNNGDSYRYVFYGSGFELVGHKAGNTGRIAVSIDGGPATTVNTYAPGGIQHQQMQYSRTGMTWGLHSVTVTKIDGSYMVLDGIRVIH